MAIYILNWLPLMKACLSLMSLFHAWALVKHQVTGLGLALFRMLLLCKSWISGPHLSKKGWNESKRVGPLAASWSEGKIFIAGLDLKITAYYDMAQYPKNLSNIYPLMVRFQREPSNTPTPLKNQAPQAKCEIKWSRHYNPGSRLVRGRTCHLSHQAVVKGIVGQVFIPFFC